MASQNNSNDRLAVNEKSRRKKNKHYEGNYKAGNVEVDERQLHRAGIRGYKICLLVFILIFLFILCVVNMLILVYEYTTLNITYNGMQSMSLYLEDGKLKFLQDSDLASVYPKDNVIGGYDNENLMFEGDGQKIQFHGGPSMNTSSIRVGPDGTDIQSKKGFTLSDPSTGARILHLDKKTYLKTNGEFAGNSFKTNKLVAPRIVSDDHQDLTFTGNKLHITGNEGVFMDGMNISFNANKDLILKVNDQKYFVDVDAKEGVQLNRMRLTDTSLDPQNLKNGERYKLCACVNSGKLFRVKLDGTSDGSCARVKNNPCI